MSELKRTNWQFTTGIVNSPLIFYNGKKIMIEMELVNSFTGKLQKVMKPKTNPDMKYLFWEIDFQDGQLLREVLLIYNSLDLPVYYHNSMRGIHFLSIVPIGKYQWKEAIKELRHTNEGYPPITLRIKANKYDDELKQYRVGNIDFNKDIESNGYHEYVRKTIELKSMIERQNIGLLNLRYYLVRYPMDNNDIDKKMTLEERERSFIKQIEDSPVEVNE